MVMEPNISSLTFEVWLLYCLIESYLHTKSTIFYIGHSQKGIKTNKQCIYNIMIKAINLLLFHPSRTLRQN
jgi:hypothetical protein